MRQRTITFPATPHHLLIIEPDTPPAANAPLFLVLAGARTTALNEPYCDATPTILAAGGRVVSFDLPFHGDQASPAFANAIDGFVDALKRGYDPFDEVLAAGRATLDYCLANGLATPGRLGFMGISRGGYSGLRLMADDPRWVVGTAIAPVTDWGLVSEFAALRNEPRLNHLRLHRFIDALAGRPLYVVISTSDDRVSTASAVDLMARLYAIEERRKPAIRQAVLHVEDATVGHCVRTGSHAEAAQFFLSHLPAAGS